jgi:hypothetical protein
VLRLIWKRQVSEKTRKSLSGEWDRLANHIEDSEGIRDAYGRYQNALEYLTKQGRDEATQIAHALPVWWDRGDPGDEPDEPEGRRSFRDGIKGAIAFDRADFRLAWHIKRVLVAGQPAVVGAPKKAMKTSTMLDMAVPGRGPAVPRRVRRSRPDGRSGSVRRVGRVRDARDGPTNLPGQEHQR